MFWINTIIAALKGAALSLGQESWLNSVKEYISLSWLKRIAKKTNLSLSSYDNMKAGISYTINKNYQYLKPEQKPIAFFYPGLKAQPFWNPKDFPIVQKLEENVNVFREELLALKVKGETFTLHPEAKLASNGTWAHLHFFASNKKIKLTEKLCPKTMNILEKIRPTSHDLIYFSAQAPGTQVQPHFGPHNMRLRIHLGLLVPDKCEITVGGETRKWEEGKCLVFDDSFLHSVKNNADSTRFVLIFDIWHPHLKKEEISAFNMLVEHFQKIEQNRLFNPNSIWERKSGQKLKVDLWKNIT